MKKQHLMIALAMVFTLGVQNIAMAQNNNIDNNVIETASIESTEISNTPVPYRPDIAVQKPNNISERAYYFSCHVSGVASGSSLNVRSEPSTSGKIVGSFAADATIFCESVGDHEYNPDWWYAKGKDKSSGKTIYGWVSADYVTCSPNR